MPRVLYLSTDLQRGGLPLRLCRLVLRLRDLGVTPIVGCLTTPGPLSDELSAAGIEVFACGGRGGLDVSCLWRFAGFVRRFDPDLIHASLFHSNLAARLLGRCDRPRPIITSTVTIEIERAWHRWGEWATAGLSSLHVANGLAVAAHLKNELAFSPDRLAVIPNGIELAGFESAEPIDRASFGIPSDVPIVLWVGRMDRVKDLSTFVNAVRIVAAGRRVQAVLVGDGPERSAVMKSIHDSGGAKCFALPGWSNDVVRWLKAASCLVLTSRTEGCPNVLLEAMACRCPVVASDIQPCQELITHNQHGLLAPVGHPKAFAEAIAHVLADRIAAARRCEAAVGRVEQRHDLSRVAEQWVHLYQRLLGS